MANEFDSGKGSESMSISISEIYISRQDDRYEIDVNNTKNKMQQAKKQYLRVVHWIYRYNPYALFRRGA